MDASIYRILQRLHIPDVTLYSTSGDTYILSQKLQYSHLLIWTTNYMWIQCNELEKNLFAFCFIAHYIFLCCIDSHIYEIPSYAICLSPPLCFVMHYSSHSFASDKIRFRTSAFPIFTTNFRLRTDGCNARQICVYIKKEILKFWTSKTSRKQLKLS
jgi:hypothetical protein